MARNCSPRPLAEPPPGGGNGLWAAQPFAKNQLITEYVGEIIGREEAKQRKEAGRHTHIRWGKGGRGGGHFVFAGAGNHAPSHEWLWSGPATPHPLPPCRPATCRALSIQHSYIDGLKAPQSGRGGGSFANDVRDAQLTNAVYCTK